MSVTVQVFYYLAAAAVVVSLGWLATKGNQRRFMGDVLLCVLSVLVGVFLFQAAVGNKLGRTNGAVAVDEAEMQLRLVSMFQAVKAGTYETLEGALAGSTSASSTPARALDERVLTPHGALLPKGKQSPDTDAVTAQEAYKTTLSALKKAIDQNPGQSLYKAKMAILLGTIDLTANKDQVASLISQTAQTPGQDEQSKNMRALGSVLDSTYVEQQVPASQVALYARTLMDELDPGWYRERALTQLYVAGKDAVTLEQYRKQIETKYQAMFYKLLATLAVVLTCGLAGIATVIVQTSLLSKDGPRFPDEVGLKVPLKTVYAVFIGWFAVEILISLVYHALQSRLPQEPSQALSVALTTAVSYVVGNFAGPLLIFFLALKPANLKFLEAMRMTLRTSTSGPWKLVGAGVLGWCSAMPLVFISALIVHRVFGLQGSDNPVLGQIMQAASASSIAATAVFYLTLGVLAPLFEETFFRGYVYAALKTKIGAGWGIVLSAALFALMHFDKGGALMLFVIGFVLAFLYERTRSLIPSMICHGLWNSGTFTLALVLFGS